MATKEWTSATTSYPGHLGWGRGWRTARPWKAWRTKPPLAWLFPNLLLLLLQQLTQPRAAQESAIPSAGFFLFFFFFFTSLTFRCLLNPFWSTVAKKGPRRSSTSQSSVCASCQEAGSLIPESTKVALRPGNKGPRHPEWFPEETTRGRQLSLPGWASGEPGNPTVCP